MAFLWFWKAGEVKEAERQRQRQRQNKQTLVAAAARLMRGPVYQSVGCGGASGSFFGGWEDPDCAGDTTASGDVDCEKGR